MILNTIFRLRSNTIATIKQVFFIILMCLFAIAVQKAFAHEVGEDRGQADADYPSRFARIQYLRQYEMDEGLRQRAVFKIQRKALESAKTGPQEMQRLLFRGPRPAFPFTAQPELKSADTVKTITALVDFKDIRAGKDLPSQAQFQANIYGRGTPLGLKHCPYESVNAYYKRASEGIVDIQGHVFDWYTFSKDRKQYEPKKAPTGPNQKQQQEYLDNQALFDLVSEALIAQDATHDFSQYDNDNDGDIDLITILYAGPRGAWASFWWAYRWEFFVPDAEKIKLDGKKLKQFVFQFVDKRDGVNDFNPKTLIHEMGHAFGLADYYDYDPKIGPPGGVGGLDMMHGNWGNHNAFSRWLLDWIKPELIGNQNPSQKTLVASGSDQPGTKAVAIFPGLSNPVAPSSEMFIVENRYRVGNDGGDAKTPNDGLLIWHVDANLNVSGENFESDNSFTPRKLIRLVRNDSDKDFAYKERANSYTYFNAGSALTPTSVPSSDSYDGKPTNVSVTNISKPKEIMTADIGMKNIAGNIPKPVATASPNNEDLYIGYDELENLDRSLAVKTSSELEQLWNGFEHKGEDHELNQTSLKRRLVLARWASKDGEKAAEALLVHPNPSFVQQNYLPVMQSWATNDPATASKWYFSKEQVKLRNSKELKTNAEFSEKLFCCAAIMDDSEAIKQIDMLTNPSEIYGALNGLSRSSEYLGIDKETIKQRYDSLRINKAIVDQIQSLERAIKETDIDSVENLKHRAEFDRFLMEGK